MAHGEQPTSNGGQHFDPEAVRNCLLGHSLTFNQIGSYLVVMESEIKVILSGQPYVALMFLVNMKTGEYFERIWNQTVTSGHSGSEKQLSEACSAFFSQGRLCLGCPVEDLKDSDYRDNFIISQTPITRKYSKACLKRLGREYPSDVSKCSECLKLMEFKFEADSDHHEFKESLNLNDFQTKTEEELSEEVENQEDYLYEGVHPQSPKQPVENIVTDGSFQMELDDQTDDVKEGVSTKPRFFLAQLITQAFEQEHGRMLSVSEICLFISRKYPYYSLSEKRWKESVRNTLTRNSAFQIIGGKRNSWKLIDGTEVECPQCKMLFNYEDDEYHNHTQNCGKVNEEHSILSKLGPRINLSHPEATDKDKSEGQNDKPTFTYAQLITMAFEQEHGRMLSLPSICLFISNKYPYYSMSESTWKESVMHTLTTNSAFQRIGGKRNSWKLIDGTEIECHRCKRLFNSDDDEYQRHTLGCRQIDEDHLKPARSYPELVYEAFEHSENNLLTVKEMTSYICNKYPYFSSRKTPLERNVFTVLIRNEKYRRTGDKLQGVSWKLTDGTEVKCLKCTKLFDSRDDEYFNHMKKRHAYGGFKCSPGCNFQAEYAEDLINHIEAGTHPDVPFVMCPSCMEQIPAKKLETHYKYCVVSKIKRLKIEKQLCTICGKQIKLAKGKYSFKLHMKMHLREQAANEAKSDVSLYHYCDQCEKRYAQQSDLIQHVLVTHKGILYKCELCPEEFNSRSEKWSHKNLMHSSDERYECKKCNIRYGTLSKLRTHMITHEPPQLECKDCGKKFHHKNMLNRHKKTHTGEKTLPCPVDGCGKMWIDSSALHKHMRQVHKMSPETKWKKYAIPRTMKKV